MKKLSLVLGVLFFVSIVTYGAGWDDVGSTVRLTTPGDKVGVGETSPQSKLHVKYSLSGPIAEEQQTIILGHNTATSYNPIGVWGKVNASGGKAIYGYNGNSGGYGGYFVGKGYFSGNVGIGTTSPTGNLEVKDVSGGESKIRITTATDANSVLAFRESATDRWILSCVGTDNNKFYFKSYDGSWHNIMTLQQDGNVGIGTTSPGEKLQVNGNLKISGSNKIIIADDGLTIKGYSGSYAPTTLKLDGASDAYLYGGHGGGIIKHNVILAHTGSEPWGNVGIGTNDPQTRLAVNGTITAKEIKIKLTGWSDFVFEDNYKLMPLDKLERHIKKEKSLPGIPTNKKVIEDGVKLGEMQAKLLEKVEELTLYVIELKKENEELKKRISRLEK